MTGYELGRKIADLLKDEPNHVADSALTIAKAILIEEDIRSIRTASDAHTYCASASSK